MVPPIESRPYGPDCTPEEREALCERVRPFRDDIVLWHEIPVPSLFQIDLFWKKLDEIGRAMPSYRLLLDLTDVQPPDAEIRARLKDLFRSQRNLRAAAAFTGGNFGLDVASRFVFSLVDVPFSAHATQEEALEALSHPSPARRAAPADLPGRAIEHLMEISFGSCSITPERIMAERNNRPMAEILTGLLFVHEDLMLRERKLKELDKLKTDFFSNISHEFRTPLTLILGPLEELLSDRAPPPPRDQLELIQRNALRLLKLVNTLLDFSRIEAGRGEATFEPTDLALFTRELASSYRSATDRAGLSLVVDCPPLPAPVHVDRDMWEKIVLNLISNAFKFTFKGGIRVSLQTDGDSVKLEVADTGVGIPPLEVDRVFDRFHRVPGTKGRTHEGTGIGLAFVKELVQLHGGAIGVTSKLDEGSVFTVRIPRGHEHLPASAVRRAASPARATPRDRLFVEETKRWGVAPESPAAAVEPGSGGARVLVAEDNADMRDYVTRLLSPHWKVEAVPDGLTALSRAREWLPDIVVADIMMPGLDGIELLRRLRGGVETREIPVVLLSARAAEEARLEGLDQGADAYLIKPFSARELVARVNGLLVKYRRSLERLREKNEELKHMVSELQTFAHVSAHDLQEPARVIITYLQLLEARCRETLPPNGREYITVVIDAAKQLRALIEGLLHYATFASQQAPYRAAIVDCNGLVDGVIQGLHLMVEESGAEIVRGVLPRVRGDAVLLSQLFRNFLANALKFRRPDAAPRVTIGAEKSGRLWTFSIEDNGIGIPKEYHEKIFVIFQRLHTADKYPGTGIGLALCKKIVERHGGSCGVRSEPGKGSTFYFTLPEA